MFVCRCACTQLCMGAGLHMHGCVCLCQRKTKDRADDMRESALSPDRMCVRVRVHTLVGVYLPTCMYAHILPWTKKEPFPRFVAEKNAVPHVISCSITRDQTGQGKSRGKSRMTWP